jgi:thioredoxin 1
MKVLKFQASWCGPCKSLSKIIESVKDEIKVPIEEIDIDEHSDIAATYGIRNVPTMVLIDGDTEVSRKVGVLNAAQLKEFLEVK